MLGMHFAVVAVALVVAAGLNHQPTLVATGPANEIFAAAVANAGDVDGDGSDDLLVHSVDQGGLEFARVHSGADASLLYTFGPVANGGSLLGATPIAGVGDVDGDGRDDVVIGNAGASEVRVHSGLDGSVLRVLRVPFLQPYESFGDVVAGAGDVDADGAPDVLVGGFGLGPSAVRVFSGSSGTLLRELAIQTPWVGFGRALAGIGDVNGDGHADVAVGAPGDGHVVVDGAPPFFPPFKRVDGAGALYVFSGLDGARLFRVVGDVELDGLGFSVAAAGDVNGDGVPDVVTGSRGTEFPGSGYARVLSGQDGAVLHTFLLGAPGHSTWVRIAGPGDVDGDGRADVLVGRVAAGMLQPDAEVFSGFDGTSLFQYHAPVAYTLGAVNVCGLGDVDQDLTPDFAVGIAEPAFGLGFVQWFVSL